MMAKAAIALLIAIVIALALVIYLDRSRAETLAGRFETIAQGMESTDPNFFSEDVAALVRAARLLRGLDMPGNGQA